MTVDSWYLNYTHTYIYIMCLCTFSHESLLNHETHAESGVNMHCENRDSEPDMHCDNGGSEDNLTFSKS